MEIIKEVKTALEILAKNKFKAYIVGGCVRDLVLGKAPKDWDITTSAKPEDIERTFQKEGYKTFYENAFGTVTAIIGEVPLEITPFRKEGKYSNKRHPDEITWADTLEEDLARRDFTINAMALELTTNDLQQTTKKSRRLSVVGRKLADPFDGKEDIAKKILRTVGKPSERFAEDALRLMRACRIALELGFEIEKETHNAIKEHASSLNDIAKERIRDEFIRIILADKPEEGIALLEETGLLAHIVPELLEGKGLSQRGPHRFDIYKHNVLSLKHASRETESLAIRLAALFHDIGKTPTRQITPEGKITFYDHPVVGAKMVETIMARLHFPKKLIEEVSHLVYHHMFYYDVGKVTPSGVRRLLNRLGGIQTFRDLLIVRHADRKATPVPKTHPYRLRHLEYMVESVASDPLARSQLLLTGDDIKELLDVPEGIRIGLLINALLAEVLEDPKKNTKANLKKRVKELNELSDKELAQKGEFVEEKKKERENILKAKYYVR